jgi:hypothetical protein
MPDKAVSAVLVYPTGSRGEAEHLAAFTYTGGNAYVVAGPGTAKAFLLVGRYPCCERAVFPARKLSFWPFPVAGQTPGQHHALQFAVFAYAIRQELPNSAASFCGSEPTELHSW